MQCVLCFIRLQRRDEEQKRVERRTKRKSIRELYEYLHHLPAPLAVFGLVRDPVAVEVGFGRLGAQDVRAVAAARALKIGALEAHHLRPEFCNFNRTEQNIK